MRRILRAGAVLSAVGLTLALSVAPVQARVRHHRPVNLPASVAAQVNLPGMYRHLAAFQRQADQNGGTRAPGTPGYEASKNYVVGNLQRAGFHVSIQEFPVRYSKALTETLTVGGKPISPMHMVLYTQSTPAAGLTGRLATATADDSLGCNATDFAGADYTGTIVLLKRGVCTFAVKLANAAHAGAAAVVFYNDTDTWLRASLGSEAAAVIPAGGVSLSLGQQLIAKAGQLATLNLQVFSQMRTGRTVIAQTRTGRTDNVVVAGAHLDSVVEGAGINSNGSGAAALLETALKLGSAPKVTNAVRFIFWGAWEFGIVSAPYYVSQLSAQEKQDIALYLNFDGIASPNAGYFVYNGNDAGSPPGSAQITQAFSDALAKRGVKTETIPMSSRFEHGPFVAAGIPSGGLHTGLTDLKTPAQAAEWGGQAGQPFDACYHEACDTIRNLNVKALVNNAKAMATVITQYAVSTTDPVYGIPNRG